MNRFKLRTQLLLAFGAVTSLVVLIAVVALNGLGKLEADAEQISHRDVQALKHLVTVSEDFL